MARHQSTRVLVVRAWRCPLNCPSAAGSLGDIAGGEGGDGQRAAGDLVVAAPGAQFPQVEPSGGEGVAGKPENQRCDRGADQISRRGS